MLESSLPEIKNYSRWDPNNAPKTDVLDVVYHKNTDSLHVSAYMRTDRYLDEFQNMPVQHLASCDTNVFRSEVQTQYTPQQCISYHANYTVDDIQGENPHTYNPTIWKEDWKTHQKETFSNQSLMHSTSREQNRQFKDDYMHRCFEDPSTQSLKHNDKTSFQNSFVEFLRLDSPILAKNSRGSAPTEELSVTHELIESNKKQPAKSPERCHVNSNNQGFFNNTLMVSGGKKFKLGKSELCKTVDGLNQKKIKKSAQRSILKRRQKPQFDEIFRRCLRIIEVKEVN